jgi:parallel beta-helix repeat protein
MKYLGLILVMAGLCFGNISVAADYYVNPKGNDLWSGMLRQPNAKLSDGPFKTLERAKQVVKTLKQNHKFKEKVTFHIAGGQYFLDHPLNFSLFDSGLPGKEVLWQGETGSEAVISGGIPVACNRLDAKLWECPLKQLPANKEVFDLSRSQGDAPKFEIYVSGQKFELARWPNAGWAHIKQPLDEKTRFSVIEQLPGLTGDIKAAQVHIFSGNDWYDQYLGLESYNPKGNVIKLSSQTGYPLASGYRFYVQNIRSALDAPGEWFFDQQRTRILLIPHTGLSAEQAVLSSLTNVMTVDGASHLKFDNLVIQHSAGTAVELKNASQVVLERLDVSNVGGAGLEIKGGSQVSLTNSKIHHTGVDAIIVSGGDSKQLQPSGHVITNNHIHDMGRVMLMYSPGIRMYGVGTKVTHNLLEQGAGSAIILEGNDHLIEKNEIHHFCLQSSDCGAVYSGRNGAWRGNVIRHNHIHDIIGYGLESVDLAHNLVKYRTPADARGIYLDDAASGFEITGNIFENAGRIAISVSGGRDNKIVNNYFNTSGYAIAVDDRSSTDWKQQEKNLEASPYKSTTWRKKYPELVAAASMANYKLPEGNRIERNVIVSTQPGGYALKYYLPKSSSVISSNLVWGTLGAFQVEYKLLGTKALTTASWADWLAEHVEKDSVYADPCVTVSGSKMTACPTSPIKNIGFTTLPNDIGLAR